MQLNLPMFVPNVFVIILTSHCNKCVRIVKPVEIYTVKHDICNNIEKLDQIHLPEQTKVSDKVHISEHQHRFSVWPGWLEPAGLPASAFGCLEEGRDLHLEDTWDSPPASSRDLIQANFCNPGFSLLETESSRAFDIFKESADSLWAPTNEDCPGGCNGADTKCHW